MDDKIASFIGMPYSLRGYNCYDHAAAIRKAFGVKTRLFRVGSLKDAYKTITAQMQKIDNGLSKVDKPKNLDIVIAHTNKLGFTEYHCGVYFDGGVSHCRRGGSSTHQPYNEFIKDFEGVTFWR